jgi:hypothetical protein
LGVFLLINIPIHLSYNLSFYVKKFATLICYPSTFACSLITSSAAVLFFIFTCPIQITYASSRSSRFAPFNHFTLSHVSFSHFFYFPTQRISPTQCQLMDGLPINGTNSWQHLAGLHQDTVLHGHTRPFFSATLTTALFPCHTNATDFNYIHLYQCVLNFLTL